ncbi:MAG: putative minor capsid protein, partial [Harvfovirus sp.]
MSQYPKRIRINDLDLNHLQLDEVSYNVTYINIDSSQRQKTVTFDIAKSIRLCHDPLHFRLSTNKYEMKIIHPEHNFCPGDKITLSGVQNRLVKLRTRLDNQCPFQFINGSCYLKILFPGIADIQPNLLNVIGPPLFVKICGFQGCTIASPYIGNIPINTLNKRHQVYFSIPTIPFSPDVIYIRLIRNFSDVNSIYVFPQQYNVTLVFDYMVGIPLNLINAKYPLDLNHQNGYHLISRVEPDGYCVLSQCQPGSLRPFGGDNVFVSKIITQSNCYPNPNYYSIMLDKVYTNVISASLVSSEFPNTEQNVNLKNNAFYWENLDDGNHIYKVELPSGNYTLEELACSLENRIAFVPRINYLGLDSMIGMNFICFDIDPNSNLIAVRSIKKIILSNPVVNTIPSLTDFPNLEPVPVRIQISHPLHGLCPGDHIRIEGAISHLGIPECAINGDKIILSVDNPDTYTIELCHFNYLPIRTLTGGGRAFLVSQPNYIRLRMDFCDSLCSQLGFRHIGLPTAITNYSPLIKNCDPYEDEFGIIDPVNILPQSIKLHGSLGLRTYNYFLICCKQLGTISNLTGLISLNDSQMVDNLDSLNIFAKILLSSPPGEILYNTYVPTP